MESQTLITLAGLAAGSANTTAINPLYGTSRYEYGIVEVVNSVDTELDITIQGSMNNSTFYDIAKKQRCRQGIYNLCPAPLPDYVRISYTNSAASIVKATLYYTYCSMACIDAYVMGNNLKRWVEDSQNIGDLDAEEESLIGTSILWACSQIDKLFYPFYTTPFSTIYREVHDLAVIGALYNLFARRGIATTEERFNFSERMKEYADKLTSGIDVIAGATMRQNLDSTSYKGDPLMSYSILDRDGNGISPNSGQTNALDEMDM